MPLRTLLLSTLEDRGVQRLYEAEPSIDTSVYGSKVVNIVRSIAAAIHPVTLLAGDVLEDSFPQSAAGDALDNFAKSENLTRKPSSQSVGEALVFGEVGQEIPLQSKFDADGIAIETTEFGFVSQQSLSIVGGSASAGIATVTIANADSICRGATVEVVGSDPRVNGTRTITGANGNNASFDIDDTNPFTIPSGGALTGAWDRVGVHSIDYGVAQNLSGSTEISGDFDGFLLNGLSGGSESESDASYSQRIIDTRNLIEGVFTAPQVRLAALRVAGNTRAWVVSPKYQVFGGINTQAGYKPQPGEVCVYIMRDNDVNPIASPQVLSLTRDAIVEYGAMPCHTIVEDIHVFAPILQTCQFQIANLEPNNQELKNSIEAELKAYVEDTLDFEESFTDKQQIAVISNARASGLRASDFDLISGTFDASSGGLLTYGGVTWL